MEEKGQIIKRRKGGRQGRGGKGGWGEETWCRVTDRCWEEMTWRVRHTSWQLGLTWSQMPSSCHSDLDSICCWRNPPSPVTWGCLPAQNTAVRLHILPGQPPGTLGKDTSFVFMEKRTLTWQWEELLLTSCMTLGKSLHFSQSQFTLLKNGTHYPCLACLLGLWWGAGTLQTEDARLT